MLTLEQTNYLIHSFHFCSCVCGYTEANKKMTPTSELFKCIFKEKEYLFYYSSVHKVSTWRNPKFGRCVVSS